MQFGHDGTETEKSLVSVESKAGHQEEPRSKLGCDLLYSFDLETPFWKTHEPGQCNLVEGEKGTGQCPKRGHQTVIADDYAANI